MKLTQYRVIKRPAWDGTLGYKYLIQYKGWFFWRRVYHREWGYDSSYRVYSAYVHDTQKAACAHVKRLQAEDKKELASALHQKQPDEVVCCK